jgi:hypothetical protein
MSSLQSCPSRGRGYADWPEPAQAGQGRDQDNAVHVGVTVLVHGVKGTWGCCDQAGEPEGHWGECVPQETQPCPVSVVA